LFGVTIGCQGPLQALQIEVDAAPLEWFQQIG
jgi:hypothetical protein